MAQGVCVCACACAVDHHIKPPGDVFMSRQLLLLLLLMLTHCITMVTNVSKLFPPWQSVSPVTMLRGRCPSSRPPLALCLPLQPAVRCAEQPAAQTSSRHQTADGGRGGGGGEHLHHSICIHAGVFADVVWPQASCRSLVVVLAGSALWRWRCSCVSWWPSLSVPCVERPGPRVCCSGS